MYICIYTHISHSTIILVYSCVVFYKLLFCVYSCIIINHYMLSYIYIYIYHVFLCVRGHQFIVRKDVCKH